MSPVHIDELNPETRARVLKQISGTEGVTTALATVEEQSSLTLGDPAAMTDDQLADIVIDGVKKLRTILPSIIELKARFGASERHSTNRLKTPIRDCYSWKEFCETYLDRTPRAVNKALAVSAVFVPHSPEWNDTHPQLAEERAQIKEEESQLGLLFKRPTAIHFVGGERTPFYAVQQKFKTREEVEHFARIVNTSVAPVAILQPASVPQPVEAPQQLQSAAARSSVAPKDYALTFYAIRHKASGFFVQQGPCLFTTDDSWSPVDSLRLTHILHDNPDTASLPVQMGWAIKELSKQTANRKHHYKSEDFELVEVRAAYTVKPVEAQTKNLSRFSQNRLSRNRQSCGSESGIDGKN